MKDHADASYRALIAEAIRRANWAATQGPKRLRAGRFFEGHGGVSRRRVSGVQTQPGDDVPRD